MADLKFLLWNMEWMNDLFVTDQAAVAFRPDNEPTNHGESDRVTVKVRRDALAGVINELSPDLMVVVEGPNKQEELQLFFDTDVQGVWQTFVQETRQSQQLIGIAVRTDTNKFLNDPFTAFNAGDIPAFNNFSMDTDDDEVQEQYHFERRPLYVEIHPTNGAAFRIVGLHLKSKGIFTALEWSKWWQNSDGNRRKILAQAGQIRRSFLDPYFKDLATRDIPLMVCGDINDGPGMDASEKRLFGSGVERLMGNVWNPTMCLGNALFDTLTPRQQENLSFEKISTTSFRDAIFNNTWQYEWIDHILYSRNQNATWVHDAKVCKQMQGGAIWDVYEYASDHQPVMATVTT